MGAPKKLDGFKDELIELDEIRAQLTKLDTRKKELEQILRDALGPAEEGTVRGVTVVTYANEERMSFDQTAFKQKHPRIAARFVSFKTIRRFLVKDKAFGEAKLRG
jgi:predicted phage-related endonuclease